MKGSVLGFHQGANDGVITGQDGNRYPFTIDQWRSERSPNAGREVDFVPLDGKATEIYTPAGALSAGFAGGEKNKIVAALLAFFLGGLGIHKFYLGETIAGIIMAVVFVFGLIFLAIPSYIIGIIALIEAVLYIIKSDADFDEIYVKKGRAWF